MNLKSLKSKFQSEETKSMLLYGLLSTVVLFCFVYFLISPLGKEIERLRNQKNQKIAELATFRNLKQNRARLLQQIVVKQGELDSIKEIFPDEKEIPALIKKVWEKSFRRGLFTSRFNPAEDIEREYYIENPYNLEIWGTYHEFAQFINDIAKIELICNLDKLAITTHEMVKRSMAAAQSGQQINTQNPEMYSIVARFNLTTFSTKK